MQAVLFGPAGLPINTPTPAIVDPTAAALRVTYKPIEYSYPGVLGGCYRVAVPLTGGITTSIAALAPLLAFRWAPTSTGLLAIIKNIVLQFGVRTAGSSAAIICMFDAIRATSFSVQDTGGTALALAATCKLRSSMANSQALIQYASGTTALTAGTRTLDPAAFGAHLFDEQGATGTVRALPSVELYRDDSPASHALVLANNEGFVLRNINALTSTAFVCDIIVNITWAEALQY